MMIQWLLAWLLPLASADMINAQSFEQNSSPLKALVFLSDLCPCSKSHVAHLNQLQEKYTSLKIFGVISDPPQTPERKKISDEYFKNGNFKFPIIADDNQELVKKYNALKTPHVTLFKKEKDNYKVIYEGGLTNKRNFEESTVRYLEENLIELAQGKPVKHVNGICLGCYIRKI